jgi:predicted dienelactone hydrolase
VVAVSEHPGSDAKQLQALLSGRADEVTSPREFIDRPLDVKYLLDELTRLSQSEPGFQERLNLQQVGVIGQSFGGYTVLALAGAKLNFQFDYSTRERLPRIREFLRHQIGTKSIIK